jgi:hypothetical protein
MTSEKRFRGLDAAAPTCHAEGTKGVPGGKVKPFWMPNWESWVEELNS